MVWRGAAPLPQKLCIDDNCVVYASWDNIIEKGGGGDEERKRAKQDKSGVSPQAAPNVSEWEGSCKR